VNARGNVAVAPCADTTTSTLPAALWPVSAVIVVGEATWMFAAGVVPMRSVVPASKPLPVTVTAVPPNVLPAGGDTAVMATCEGLVGPDRQPGANATTRLHDAMFRSVGRGTAFTRLSGTAEW
jgi:hypothetical protein